MYANKPVANPIINTPVLSIIIMGEIKPTNGSVKNVRIVNGNVDNIKRIQLAKHIYVNTGITNAKGIATTPMVKNTIINFRRTGVIGSLTIRSGNFL